VAGYKEIDDFSPTNWVPVALFVLLAVFFLQKAVRTRARRTWSWGRVGGQVPLSRAGYAIWGFTFAVVALLLALAPKPPLALGALLVLCVPAIMAVGCSDTRAYRRANEQEQSST